MNIEPPLYAQEKPNTCALACLRMVLAAFGTHISEGELERQANLEPGGTLIDELERLARHYQLGAEVQTASMEDLRHLLAERRLPIAYIDRALFDLRPRQRLKHSLRRAKIHTVLPIRVTAASVTLHDPLGPRIARKSIGLFEQAHGILGNPCLVCSAPKDS